MNTRIYTLVSVIIASLLLMWYALYNGFPLVTGDTGAYIYFTFDFQVLKDRSSFYSIWLALAGLRTLQFAGITGSLWLPVFFQCVLVAVLFLHYYRMLGNDAVVKTSGYLLAIVVVAIATGVSFIVAYIMPDIFVAILLLAILLYLYDNEPSTKLSLLYLGLIGFSMLVHYSHFLIVPVFCILMLLYAQVTRQFSVKARLAKVLSISAVCWVLMCSINAVYGLGFTLSPGSHVFMAGKLVETGTMKKYLDEQCAEKQYKLCAYKNKLPEKAYQYVWDDNGAFKHVGGWDSSAAEHKAIIRDVFTTPRYAVHFAGQALKDTWEQLKFMYVDGNGQAFNETSAPYMSIEKHIKAELPQFVKSRQQMQTIDNSTWANIQLVLLIFSSLWVLLLLFKGSLQEHITHVYIAILLFVACNAFVTASFANVLDRLQIRVFWVLPATNIFVLVNYYWAKCKYSLLS